MKTRNLIALAAFLGLASYSQVGAAQKDEAADALSTFLVDPLATSEALERFPETLARLTQFALRREVLRLQALYRATQRAFTPL